jgi:DNA modification methylase
MNLELNKVYHLNCLDLMKQMPDNSIDSIVTDPPYGLSKEPDITEVLTKWLNGEEYTHKSRGFMGREWDQFVPSPTIWKECLRILKPGGHLLAFGGTRTFDLVSIGLRLAGFERRDVLMYMFGSGFPKSRDISKEIDNKYYRITCPESVIELKKVLIDLFNKCGKSRNQIDFECGFRACNYLTLPSETKKFDPWVNILPSAEKWEIIKKVISANVGDDQILDKLNKIFSKAHRDILYIKEKTESFKYKGNNVYQTDGNLDKINLNISAPSSDLAKKFENYGTALKPSYEPILMCRKPLEKGLTIAENVVKWGTGGINIDGCRVDFENEADRKESTNKNRHNDFNSNNGIRVPTKGIYSGDNRPPVNYDSQKGRFPANLILDDSDEVKEAFSIYSETKSGKGVNEKEAYNSGTSMFFNGITTKNNQYGDSGNVSRFFYCAKADKEDRNEGVKLSNTHTTVKPLNLMRYLVRLITPPSGIVLDPFSGSGSTEKQLFWKDSPF